ncbi:hypothetical protein [Leptospira kmetyi]|uniref:hypothetical protein n=1 Tax=Leptospira kmetyi TaxID=408139 RepID=UPI00028805CC|nr:hypothetical protein [Leptospira kmetyi]
MSDRTEILQCAILASKNAPTSTKQNGALQIGARARPGDKLSKAYRLKTRRSLKRSDPSPGHAQIKKGPSRVSEKSLLVSYFMKF